MSADRITGLSVDGVTHRFAERVVLQAAAMEIAPAAVHVLVGPSGSGKSTLLRLVAGLERLQHGRIAIDGTVVADRSTHHGPESRSVGMVFQDPALFPHLDVAGNVAFGLETTGDEREARVSRLLDRVGMGGHERSMPHTLSGGEQQRVALARALARRPRVMLLDEPFSALDSSLRADVRRATLRVLRDGDVATMLVTHDPAEALEAADRISVIREGRIVQSADADELYRRPVDRETAEMFGPINEIDGRLVRPEAIRLAEPGGGGGAPATIESIVRQGSTVLLRLRREDGATLEACDLSTSGWRVGGRVVVRVVDDA